MTTRRPSNNNWIPFLAHFLIILSAWTLVINKIFVLSCFILILGTFLGFRRHVENYRNNQTTPTKP